MKPPINKEKIRKHPERFNLGGGAKMVQQKWGGAKEDTMDTRPTTNKSRGTMKAGKGLAVKMR